jgi:hypothetical protein
MMIVRRARLKTRGERTFAFTAANRAARERVCWSNAYVGTVLNYDQVDCYKGTVDPITQARQRLRIVRSNL